MHGAATFDADLAIERGGKTKDHRTFHLRDHPCRVHDEAAVDRAGDAMHAHAATLDRDLGHLRNDAAERLVQRNSEMMPRFQRLAPARAPGRCVQHGEMARLACEQFAMQLERIEAAEIEVYALETKHFSEGVSINEQGEYSIWFGGKPRGIPSPLEQNDRHIEVLKDVFKAIQMPTRMGFRLQPSFESLVLVSKNARIGRPKTFKTDRVLKSDQLQKWIEKNLESGSPLSIAKIVSLKTLTEIARQLVALHKPLVPDYKAKFGITEEMLPPVSPAPIVVPTPVTAPAPAPAPASEISEEATIAPAVEAAPAKLTSSKLAQKLGIKTAELIERLVALGLLELREGKPFITAKGKEAGGEFRMSPKSGPYFLWPEGLGV